MFQLFQHGHACGPPFYGVNRKYYSDQGPGVRLKWRLDCFISPHLFAKTSLPKNIVLWKIQTFKNIFLQLNNFSALHTYQHPIPLCSHSHPSHLPAVTFSASLHLELITFSLCWLQYFNSAFWLQYFNPAFPLSTFSDYSIVVINCVLAFMIIIFKI